MAVKAKGSITLSYIVDIVSVVRYYLLQSSLEGAPAKPAVNPPGGWTTVEPSYTAGSNTTLYFVDLTTFTNDTWKYSDVSKSSSYAAAKAAYEKANEATAQITNIKGEINLMAKKGDIISIINQTAETIKIDANKIDLDGYVTFNNLKTPGQTIIDGGNIVSRTVKADSLMIGDFTNYVTVNPYYPETMLPDSFQFGGTVAWSGAPTGGWSLVKKSSSQQYLMFCDYTPFCFNVGDELFFSGKLANWSSTACNVNVQIWVYDANKGYITSKGFWSGVLKANSWTDVEGSVMIDSSMVSKSKYFLVGVETGTGGHTIGGCDLVCRKKMTGKVIVNGTITADKIDVKDLFAQDITATGTIRGVKLIGAHGQIGCWNMDANRMYDNNWQSSLAAGVNRYGQGMAFWAGGNDLTGGSAPFRVGHDGSLVATKASITGDISANNLRINKNITIYDPSYPNVNFSIGYNGGIGMITFAGSASITGALNVRDMTTISGLCFMERDLSVSGNVSSNAIYSSSFVCSTNHSTMWLSALQGNAALNLSQAGGNTGFNSLARVKCTDGAYAIGAYNQPNQFVIAYGNEKLINGTTNGVTKAWYFHPNGYFETEALRVNGDSTINGKIAFRGHDSWLRINDKGGFSSGIYLGSGTVRTDGRFELGASGAYVVMNVAETLIKNELSFKDYGGGMRRPVSSASTAGRHVSYIATNLGSAGHYLNVCGEYGNSFNFETFNFLAASSDARLKERILPTETAALPVIDRIQMRQFYWRENGVHQKIGMVADELETLDPLFVVGGGFDEDGNINYKSIDTLYLLAYVVKGIQELCELTTKLQTRISTLEGQVASLQAA